MALRVRLPYPLLIFPPPPPSPPSFHAPPTPPKHKLIEIENRHLGIPLSHRVARLRRVPLVARHRPGRGQQDADPPPGREELQGVGPLVEAERGGAD